MTIKNRRKNISAEPGDVVLDITKNTLNKQNESFSNNLILTITQQDFINETNTSHTKTIEIPLSEVVRLAYLQNNYYSKTQSDTRYNVNVEKQTTADSGYAATYVIKQNGSQVGTKINIPKDFLVRSATLKTVTTNNQPVNGYNVGDKYIDFVINTSDNSESNQHVYINVKDLVDVYTADESTLTVSNNQFSVKNGGITSAKLATALQNTINNKVDKVSGKGLSTNDYTNADKNAVATIANKADTAYVDDQILSILDPSGEIKIEIASKADEKHSHGNITWDGKLGTANALVITNTNKQITTANSISKSKISDFAHTHPTTEVIEANALNNIGSLANANQSTINSKINAALSNKVDKVSGKALSTNDFTNDLLSKLNNIEAGANKYVHPTASVLTGNPSVNQTPGFGGSVTISQVKTNNTGHVASLTDRTITIPATESSASVKGLMTAAQFIKLRDIEAGANKYIHPTQTALTGLPTAKQTPGFGGDVKVSQVSVNTSGHVSSLTERIITIPSTVATASVLGLSKVINNLTTSAHTDGVALSAYQGKVLNDTKWTKAPTNVSTNINFNDYKTPGTYKIWGAQETGNQNAPDTQGGLLLVHEIPNGFLQVLTQYYVADSKVFYRIYHNDVGWRPWKEVLTNSYTLKAEIGSYTTENGYLHHVYPSENPLIDSSNRQPIALRIYSNNIIDLGNYQSFINKSFVLWKINGVDYVRSFTGQATTSWRTCTMNVNLSPGLYTGCLAQVFFPDTRFAPIQLSFSISIV